MIYAKLSFNFRPKKVKKTSRHLIGQSWIVSTVWGPVLGHKRLKLVFLTSEEPQELEISPTTSFSIQFICVKLSPADWSTPFFARAITKIEALFAGSVLSQWAHFSAAKRKFNYYYDHKFCLRALFYFRKESL